MKTTKKTMSKQEFTSKMEMLDRKYKLIKSHIAMLEDQLAETEADMQKLLDEAAGLTD